MPPVMLEPSTPRSGVKHSTTEPPHSSIVLFVLILNVLVNNVSVALGWVYLTSTKQRIKYLVQGHQLYCENQIVEQCNRDP